MLMDDNDRITLIDFGAATRMNENPYLNQMHTTYTYASPEQLAKVPYLPTRNDVWGLGVVLFRLLHGKNPYIVTEFPLGSGSFNFL